METEHGAAIEAPPDERGGNRLATPKPPRHLSTLLKKVVSIPKSLYYIMVTQITVTQ